MKRLIPAIALILAVASPVVATGMGLDGLPPTLTYPDPIAEPVTQDTSGIDK